MRIYGHRGAKGEAPENTLEGFVHAYRHGIRHFEMDILLSSDGVPVVLHDLTLERTTGDRRRAADVSAKEMAGLDARWNTSSWHHSTGVPSLEDVVRACPDFEHLQLEVKPDSREQLNRLCNRLVEWIQRRKLHTRVSLTSRSPRFLRAVRRSDRRISTGYVAERRFPLPVTQAYKLGCKYLCCSYRLCDPGLVRKAHQAGLSVSVWTVNRIHDMLLLEEMGVNSIITDYPTSTLIYFENRGEKGELISHRREHEKGPALRPGLVDQTPPS